MIIWIILWAAIIFIVGYEILSLLTHERIFPTISRWIWTLQKKYPKLKWYVLAVTLLICLGISTWLSIHFFFGECAFGVC